MTSSRARHGVHLISLSTGLAALGSAALVLASSAPAQADPGTGIGGQDQVSGYTQQQCDQAGAAISQQRQNAGYTTTFVGCSYSGSGGQPYQGTVYWKDRGAGTGGQDQVSGYSQQQCDEAGAADSQQRQDEGYTTTFVGCAFDGSTFPSYRGTVYYHEGRYA